MEEFSIKGEIEGDKSVVKVTGRIDSVTATTLDSELEKIASENNKIVLDLSQVAYLSSAGVRAIVRILQNTSKSGGGLKLASAPKHVLDVLETVGMMQVLQVYPSVEEAIADF